MSGFGPGAPQAGQPYGQPPYQGGPPPGYPQPGGYPPAPRRRRSRLPLFLGIAGAAVLLLVVANIIVFTVVLNHHGQTSDTMALYRKIGRPAGFHQQGDPTVRGHVELNATLTATKSGSYSPVAATTTWLASVGGSNPPTTTDVDGDFAEGRTVYSDRFEPHAVDFALSSNGSTYTIKVQIIY